MPSKCPIVGCVDKLKAGLSADDLSTCKEEITTCVSPYKTPLKIFLGGLTYEHTYAVIFNAAISVLLIALAWSLPANALFNICLVITMLLGAKFVLQQPAVESKLNIISSKLKPENEKLDMFVEALAAVRAHRRKVSDKVFSDNKKILAVLGGLAFVSFFISTPVIATVALVILNALPFYVKYVMAAHAK